MTIQECYRKMDGDFAQVEKRLSSASLVKKFIAKFPDDESFSQLELAVQAGQCERAFRAAHTLKGVSANLGLTRLFSSVSQLTELLRAQAGPMPADAGPLFQTVKQDYELTVGAIREYLSAGNG